jgi:hypothetical protein
VVKNRALAAAYAGAHRFAVEVFEPADRATAHNDLTLGGSEMDNPFGENRGEPLHCSVRIDTGTSIRVIRRLTNMKIYT